jgi:hypothetical protein
MLIDGSAVTLTTGNETQSGNGQLDLILFGYAGGGGVTDNEVTAFNGDDANTQAPGGGTSSIAGSYITSMGELRAFYRLNFPDGQGGSMVGEIVLFVDLNETGKVNDIQLDDLRIAIDYSPFPGSDPRNTPATVDITSTTQNSTGSTVSGGTTLAQLESSSAPLSLPLNVQGAGWADLYIRTGINPFAQEYQDSTPVQFAWASHDHDDGGDKVFLSGGYNPFPVPEPVTLALLALGGLLAARRKA